MIEHLSGRLIEKTPTKAVISAGGVGYAALISLATYERLPEAGGEAALHTWLAVREDALTLYGFATTAEREFFLLLTGVTGVGPKLAIGILSSAGVDVLRENLAQGNAAALTRLPGIGRKLAERLALELRDKVGSVAAAGPDGSSARAGTRDEALAALLALGYNRTVAERALRSALKEGPENEATVEALIKAALKHAAGT
ncbi:MAG: Holliday junction branch migration protein RuvA [Bacteroidetes bacterium]|nr:Holliday junction branch migration protein RuvA [Bacteroidota bacterium]